MEQSKKGRLLTRGRNRGWAEETATILPAGQFTLFAAPSHYGAHRTSEILSYWMALNTDWVILSLSALRVTYRPISCKFWFSLLRAPHLIAKTLSAFGMNVLFMDFLLCAKSFVVLLCENKFRRNVRSCAYRCTTAQGFARLAICLSRSYASLHAFPALWAFLGRHS